MSLLREELKTYIENNFSKNTANKIDQLIGLSPTFLKELFVLDNINSKLSNTNKITIKTDSNLILNGATEGSHVTIKADYLTDPSSYFLTVLSHELLHVIDNYYRQSSGINSVAFATMSEAKAYLIGAIVELEIYKNAPLLKDKNGNYVPDGNGNYTRDPSIGNYIKIYPNEPGRYTASIMSIHEIDSIDFQHINETIRQDRLNMVFSTIVSDPAYIAHFVNSVAYSMPGNSEIGQNFITDANLLTAGKVYDNFLKEKGFLINPHLGVDYAKNHLTGFNGIMITDATRQWLPYVYNTYNLSPRNSANQQPYTNNTLPNNQIPNPIVYDTSNIEEYTVILRYERSESLILVLNILDISQFAEDPIVVDLTGTGVSLSGLTNSSPYYDYTGNGIAHQTGWTNTGTALLVFQDSSGNYKPFTGLNSQSGITELTSFDTNSDGIINSQDTGFTQLAVWNDVNGNGIVDSGEIQSLSDVGIISISLAFTASTETINGNAITATSYITMLDGTQHKIADVNFQTSNVYTKSVNQIIIPSDVQALFQLNQYGNLLDLHTSMVNDATLKTIVQNLSANILTMSVTDIETSVENILFQWAGVENVDPTSRGGILDARRIEFMEKYLGQNFSFVGNYGNPDSPGSLPALIANQAYEQLQAGIIARVLIQTTPDLSSQFFYNSDLDIILPAEDMRLSVYALDSILSPLTSSNLDTWMKYAYIIADAKINVGITDANFMQDITDFSKNLGGLDILVNTIPQGLSTTIKSDGTLLVSNDIKTGILINDFGRESGRTFVYNGHDGKVELQFSNPAWLEAYQGWTPNKLLVGLNSQDAVSMIDQNGNMVLTDGVTGDQLTIDNETVSGNTQYGVQNIEFQDGTIWTQARITAVAGQTDLISNFQNIDYDTKGLVSTIETTGNGNGIIYNLDYGAVAVTFTGVNNVIRFGSNISASDITATLSGQNVILTDGITGDSLTLLNDFYVNYLGINSHVSAVTFQDGTVEYLGQNATLPFTWLASSGVTSLVGSQYGVNKFILDNNSDSVTFGNNSLGSSGKNILEFSKGNGSVLVNINGGTGEFDFGIGISASDVLLQAGVDNNLVVALKDDTTDSITLQGDLYQIYNGIGSLVSSLKFQDGSTMQIGPTLSLSWQASGGNTITGSGWGSNTYIIGAGGATINPGHGEYSSNYDNTYVYSKGDGVVNANVSGSWTYLKLSSDFTPDDVMFQSVGSTMVVAFKNSPDDKLIFANDLYPAYGNAGSSLRHITFDNGTNYDIGYTFYGQGADIHFTDMGTATHTTLVGSQYGDNLFILGPGGDTVIPGRAQQGGSYENRYMFSHGIGHAVADASGAWNNVLFGSGISQSDVMFQNVGNDLVVSLKGDEADSITFQKDLYTAYGNVLSCMKYVTFSDASTYNVGYTYYGQGAGIHFTEVETSTSNILTGSDFGDNTFLLGPNSDVVTGGNGSLGGSNLNTYMDNGITGNAVINPNGGVSQLSMIGLTETDVSVSTNANIDLLASTSIVDSVAITAGLAGWNTTSLTFQDGNVWDKAQLTEIANGVITGSNADDVLVAKTGNQTLTGNGGNDQYVVGLGKGTTVVDNSSTIDTVQHGKLIVGLDESNIWLSQSGDDLLVQALNSSDLVDIKNWFTGASNQLVSLQTHDGYKVSDVSGLVSAMSAYSSANPSFSVGSTIMPSDASLQSALTNSWHR